MPERAVNNHSKDHMEYPKMDAWMLGEIEEKRRKNVAIWWESVIAVCFLIVFTVVMAIVFFALTTPQVRAEAINITDLESVHAVVTAYTSSEDETDSTPFENAAGTVPGRGSVACPMRFAFGTRVLIRGHEYICDDRMHPKFGDRFDVWMQTKAEAFEFGKQHVTVAIIN